jgi:hypothetical protein
MLLLHKEHIDGCHIQHATNGREYRPPELAHYSVDEYCAETRNFYEFLDATITDINANLPVITMVGDN